MVSANRRFVFAIDNDPIRKVNMGDKGGKKDKRGNIVKVEGGPEADMIRKVWAEMGDASVYNICSLP